MSKIKLDEREYELSDLSEYCNQLVDKIRLVNTKIKDNSNMQALLTKAKKAYISELKSEMLAAKAGFEFGED